MDLGAAGDPIQSAAPLSPLASTSPRPSVVVGSRSAIHHAFRRFSQDIHEVLTPLLIRAATPRSEAIRRDETDGGTQRSISRQYSLTSLPSETESSDVENNIKWTADYAVRSEQVTNGALHKPARSIEDALKSLVSKVERRLGSLLSRIQSSVQSAARGFETLHSRCHEAERKVARQSEHIDDLEIQLEEARKAIANQSRLRHLVEQLQREKEEMTDSPKFSKTVELKNDRTSSYTNEDEIADLQEEIRDLKYQLRAANEAQIGELPSFLQMDYDPETVKGKFESYISMKLNKSGEHEREKVLTDECLRLWRHVILETRLLDDASESSDLTREPSIPPVETKQIEEELKEQKRDAEIKQGEIDRLYEQIAVLTQERDAIATVANQRLSTFEIDIKALVNAEVNHIEQKSPIVAILDNLTQELSPNTQRLLNEALNSRDISREQSVTSLTESVITSGRRPRRLYRYRLQNYILNNDQ